MRSFRPVCLGAALLLVATAASAVVPQISREGRRQEPRPISGVFDRETIAAARNEIEEILAAVQSNERGSLLREPLDELERAERLLDEWANPEPLPALDPPFSLRDLDRTLERLQTVSARRLTLEDAVGSAERTLDQATRVLDDTRRRFADGSASRDAVRVANERVRLARFQLRNARTDFAIAVDQVERLTHSAEDKRRGLQVTKEDLTERVAELERLRATLAEERRQVESEIEEARSALRAALDEGPPEARADALHARLNELERRTEILDARDSDVAMAIDGWTLRYRLAAGELDSPFDKNRAERRLAANLSELIHERDLSRAERERLRTEILRLESDRGLSTSDDRSRWIDARLATLTGRLETEGGHAAMLETYIADHRRFLEEFAADSVAENVREGVAAIGLMKETGGVSRNFEVAQRTE
ncbi:MAG: TolC family protein [Acidobacteriota bacterium]|nr:MAG: TolC family protein [Acidobacteriota bacterium]